MTTPGEISDLEWLLRELERLPIDPAAKTCVIDTLCGLVGRRVFFSARVLLRAARVREVVRMLDAGATRTQARDRLQRRYQLGRSTAYALIREALTVRRSATIVDDKSIEFSYCSGIRR